MRSYLINYARAKPELIILAVNTFVRDTEDPNPLIRALALRTMACIRVQKIVEYLIIPLGKCIDDKDPYVRKTAAICVDKFYDMDPQRCEEEGFIDRLRHMIGDSSPMVASSSPLSRRWLRTQWLLSATSPRRSVATCCVCVPSWWRSCWRR